MRIMCLMMNEQLISSHIAKQNMKISTIYAPNMYLHFTPFVQVEMWQVIAILPHDR